VICIVVMSENRNQEELKAFLKKYLRNEASSAERAAVDSWYHEIGSENLEAPLVNDLKAKAKLRKGIHQYLKFQIADQKSAWFKLGFVKYAAACILIMGAGAIAYQYHLNNSRNAQKEIVILSGSGVEKQLVLTDGSEVLLNVGSKLIISKDFGKSSRQVTLIGEAFFKVAKDKDKPFIVQAGALKTRVLGTSFNINAYPDMEKIKIAVMSGQVKVSAAAKGKEKLLAMGMQKNQTLSFYREKQSYELKTEDTELISCWRTNKLYIDNASIEEIARQLERYFQIKVLYTGKTNLKDKYTIRFNNESREGVLEILSVLTKKAFKNENNQITIK